MNSDDTRMSGVLGVFFASTVILVLSQYVIVPLRSVADWFLLPVSRHDASVDATNVPFKASRYLTFYNNTLHHVYS